ncbi:hypothetical protein [Sandaracinus amylolyticus]|uniref:hypothetical protein n=1 Tax=Sandaracinus amylolyticus TaxID=927083 RepID=UPI001F43F340|nr:hypothetical protein [Sandaracinus amylolyticus]
MTWSTARARGLPLERAEVIDEDVGVLAARAVLDVRDLGVHEALRGAHREEETRRRVLVAVGRRRREEEPRVGIRRHASGSLHLDTHLARTPRARIVATARANVRIAREAIEQRLVAIFRDVRARDALQRALDRVAPVRCSRALPCSACFAAAAARLENQAEVIETGRDRRGARIGRDEPGLGDPQVLLGAQAIAGAVRDEARLSARAQLERLDHKRALERGERGVVALGAMELARLAHQRVSARLDVASREAKIAARVVERDRAARRRRERRRGRRARLGRAVRGRDRRGRARHLSATRASVAASDGHHRRERGPPGPCAHFAA